MTGPAHEPREPVAAAAPTPAPSPAPDPPGMLDADGRVAVDTPCLGCGKRLRGLRPRGWCPSCGEKVKSSLREDLLASITFDADGRVDVEVPCAGCGYLLRGLRPTDACPECGEGIEASLRADVLRFGGPIGRARAILAGARWVLIAEVFLLLLLGSIYLWVALDLGDSDNDSPLAYVVLPTMLVSLLAAPLWLAYGFLWLCWPPREWRLNLRRRLLMLGLLAWVVLVLAVVDYPPFSTTTGHHPIAAALGAAIAGYLLFLPTAAACDSASCEAQRFISTRGAWLFRFLPWVPIGAMVTLALVLAMAVAGLDAVGPALGGAMLAAGGVTLVGMAVAWGWVYAAARRCVRRLRDPSVPFDQTGWAGAVPPTRPGGPAVAAVPPPPGPQPGAPS